VRRQEWVETQRVRHTLGVVGVAQILESCLDADHVGMVIGTDAKR
jgi:HD superfamily phosphohydrolase YqeK